MKTTFAIASVLVAVSSVLAAPTYTTTTPPSYPPVYTPPTYPPTSTTPAYPPINTPPTYPPVFTPPTYPPVYTPPTYPPSSTAPTYPSAPTTPTYPPGGGNGGNPYYACKGLAGSAQCCATNILGIANLNCASPGSVLTSPSNFRATCASKGQQARCCVIPILGQGLLCRTPNGL
ncbi:Fungal hydrophobin [Microdochium nivale]|nr:Fungal hydrophobin [Microdochium nivale]